VAASMILKLRPQTSTRPGFGRSSDADGWRRSAARARTVTLPMWSTCWRAAVVGVGADRTTSFKSSLAPDYLSCDNVVRGIPPLHEQRVGSAVQLLPNFMPSGYVAVCRLGPTAQPNNPIPRSHPNGTYQRLVHHSSQFRLDVPAATLDRTPGR
jgi:hypothetical protein